MINEGDTWQRPKSPLIPKLTHQDFWPKMLTQIETNIIDTLPLRFWFSGQEQVFKVGLDESALGMEDQVKLGSLDPPVSFELSWAGDWFLVSPSR